MEIILRENIKGIGFKNDIVDVKPGYGRNYLIPQGFAILATPSNKKVQAENLKQAAHKAEKLKAEAEATAAGVAGLKIEIKAKIGDSGKIFGAITTLMIADALKEKGYSVDRKQISFPVAPKEAGEFKAELALHKKVSAELSFAVVSNK
jgi:large subunit ribosomal protein L9